MGNISEFSTQFGQGVRPTLFEVTTSKVSGTLAKFFIKSVQIPASNIGTIEVPYKGRKIKKPGDRTFAEWSITVLASEDLKLRGEFETWMNEISSHTEATQSENDAGNWQVAALKADGEAEHGGFYEFHNIFPSEIGAIEMNYESVDAIAEFTVTLQYDYWTGGPGSIS